MNERRKKIISHFIPPVCLGEGGWKKIYFVKGDVNDNIIFIILMSVDIMENFNFLSIDKEFSTWIFGEKTLLLN